MSAFRVYFVTFSQCLYLSVYEYLEQSPSKDPIKCSHHSTKHTTMVLHHCRGHELITGAGRNLLRMRAFARGVCYMPWLRRCLQAFWEKKEKQQSVIRRPLSVRGLLSSGWSEKQKESWSEWEGEKKRKQSQVQHMKHGSDWWQRREGHRRHGYSGLSWWSHTVRSHMCAGAWLHRYSTLIALDKHPLALTSSCVCLTFCF